MSTFITQKVGNNNSTNAYNFAGDLCEILIYDNQLGTTDRQTVESYLTAKYDL